jgi:Uma2 family endonuclease
MFPMTLAEPLEHREEPRDDHIVLLDATWSDYQRFLELRGDRSVPRVSFLDGVVELTSASQDHESLKSLIGRLVEVWCLERGVEFRTLGSWTLESKEAARGVEPDECWVFGDAQDAHRPDLAIEVIWTSGGLDKREIYRLLGVREVWFWRRGRIAAYVLRGDTYVAASASEVLPGIDLAVLGSFLDRPTTSQAIREYRAALAR